MSQRMRVYPFCNSCTPGRHSGYALSQSGDIMNDWTSANHLQLEEDLKKDVDWDYHFQFGVDFEFVSNPHEHPGLLDAIQKNKEGLV